MAIRYTASRSVFLLLASMFGVCPEGGAVGAPEQALRGAASSFQLPLRFEPNRGQFDEPVRYLARGPGYGLYLTPEGATLSLRRSLSDSTGRSTTKSQVLSNERRAVVSMRLVGGRRDIEPVGSSLQPGSTNYFVGRDSSRWKTGVEGYARVRYSDVLPGVDLVYYGAEHGAFEYDLIVARGSDPKGVALAFVGAESVTIDDGGAAVIRLPGGGEIVQPAPVAYQSGTEGAWQYVDVRYELRDGCWRLQ